MLTSPKKKPDMRRMAPAPKDRGAARQPEARLIGRPVVLLSGNPMAMLRRRARLAGETASNRLAKRI